MDYHRSGSHTVMLRSLLPHLPPGPKEFGDDASREEVEDAAERRHRQDDATLKVQLEGHLDSLNEALDIIEALSFRMRNTGNLSNEDYHRVCHLIGLLRKYVIELCVWS